MQSKSFNLKVLNKIKPFKKKIRVDSDKSMSIRGFLISSISHNISAIKNPLESEDVYSTIKCLKKLGIKIKKINSKKYLIHGKGLGSLSAKKNTKLNFGNSGTLARLLIGIISTTPGLELNVHGDHSLNKRNMKKLFDLMSKFGATFIPKNKFNFPLKIISTDLPVGIEYEAGVSAQLKSAVMLAALNSFGTTEIIEKKKSRDHTENMLLKNKEVIEVNKKKFKTITIYGKKKLNCLNMNIPGDPSSAAFFTALTLLSKNSSLTIKNVGLNPTRIGFYELLKRYGANISFKNIKKDKNEIFGDIQVRSSTIKPIKAGKEYYVKATDEYPILFIIAALTKGISKFSGIADLANKESNRISEMQKVLKQISVKSTFSNNEIKIFGKNLIDKNKKIKVPNLGDHRICMSTLILSLLTGVKAEIKNFETVYTSAPSFLKIVNFLGGKFKIPK